MDGRVIKKGIIYLLSALVGPTLFAWVWDTFVGSTQDTTGQIVRVLVFSAICIGLILLGELIAFIWRAAKSRSGLEILRSIDKIGNSVQLADGSHMFDILDQDYCLYESVNSSESPIRRKLRDSRHIVYHSTTAKSHLNWIEYVFWSFLGRVHRELHCDVIVSLHYDEKARETGLQSLKEQNRYDQLFQTYSQIAKKLIGKDIRVLDEENFHTKKKYARFYAYTFHNKFVKSIIQYVKQALSGELDYKGFMRKISYIESVFPIMVLSKNKMKNARLYVLDRELAHEVWQQSPFLEFKNNYGIYFITARTIVDAEGKPIRIFSPEDTVNITDDVQLITQKLKKTDVSTKRIMLQLLANSTKGWKNCQVDCPEEELDLKLVQIISDIKIKYGFGAHDEDEV